MKPPKMLGPWALGQPVPSPVEEMITIDAERADLDSMYKLLIGAIVPRPIAFVSTISPEGRGNLAPFSFFNVVCVEPPCLMISVSPKGDGTPKDTLRNIEATREFVVNTVSEWIVAPMNQCGADYPYGVDEMEKVGLTPLASQKVGPMRVKESPVQMECVLERVVPLGEGGPGSGTLVIGRIVQMHVDARAYNDGKIALEAILPVARLAGADYSFTRDIFDLPRPQRPPLDG